MPRRKRHHAADADPASALQALIDKYRTYGDFEERDLSDLNHKRWRDDDTLLHLVAWNGGPDEVSLLAASGANVNLPGDIGYTPLHYAAGWGKLDNMIRLLELGADPHLKDIFGATAKIVAEVGAVSYPERKEVYVKIAKLLWKAGQH